MASKDLVVKEEEIKDVNLFVVEAGDEERLSQEELELPFLRVAQKGTPQVDEDKPEYIEGLKPGHFFNTAAGKSYGDTIKVQVHGYFQSYVIWKGEKGQGEFSGTMTPEEFAEFEKANKLTRDGGDMVHVVDGEQFRYTDTRNYIVSLPEHLDDGILVYPMASTGIKASRNWNTRHRSRRINGQLTKRYATIWELKTKGFEKNGFSWKQVSSIEPVGWATPELMAYGKEFEDFASVIKANGVKYSEGHDTESVDDSEF